MSGKKEVFLVIFLLSVIAAVYMIYRVAECEMIGHNALIEADWRVGPGCMVKVDNKWVPYDKYRVVE